MAIEIDLTPFHYPDASPPQCRVRVSASQACLEAHRATFIVRGPELLVRWATTWGDPQEHRSPLAQLAGVTGERDGGRSANREPTAHLDLTFADGPTIRPLARVAYPLVEWTAARLRELLEANV